MVANWVKILLFVAGGVTAAGATAYVLYDSDPEAGRIEQLAAADPASGAAEEDGDAAPAGDAAIPIVEDAPGGQEQSAAAPPPAADQDAVAGEAEGAAAADKGERLVPPSFDIVRVEPDGSMVIAGSAAPGAAIEVVAGADVIARATAGEAGDFAAVLDEPLSPGDYQIVLRATDPDDVVATSVETAVVSVPEREDGQVLALVEEPGAPSKLITMPKAEAPAEEVAAAHDAPSDGDEPAREPSADDAAPEEPAAADAPGEAAPEQDTSAGEASQSAAADSGTREQDAAQADAGGQAGAAGAGSNDETAAAQWGAGDDGGATIGGASPSQPEPQETGPEIASRGEIEGAGAEAGAVSDDDAEAGGEAIQQALVAVEAVEIEGDTVYVAGRAQPGMTVRVYANEILLGDSPVSEAGRFLVETRVELPVGDYIVRADMLRANGEVVARAAVPFSREPGERVAAVAPTAVPAGPQQAGDDPSVGAMAPQGGSGRDEVVGTDSDGVASGEEQSAGSAGTPDTASDEPAASDEDEGKGARIAVQGDGSARGTNGGGAGTAGGALSQDSEPATDLARAEPAPATSNATPVSPSTDSPEAAPAEVEQTMAAPLEPVDGSVIIRRGDTLWHISRRVYGRGIRYSTIYLANQDQIRDPDLIWPGQVFTVPDQTAEGETADMGAIADQVVPSSGAEETAAGSTQ